MTGTNRLTGFAGWLRHVTSNTPLLYRLSIHRRLALCFIFVIVLILVGDGALLRQLHLIRAQAERLDGLTEELIEVQRVHTSLTSIYDRLGVSAQSEDSVRLLKEWDTLRTGLLDDAQRIQAAFRDLPPEVKVDPTVLTTLESIERTLPSHLDAIRVLAASGDWEAVHLRLERQLRPLEFLSSELVKDVHREAGEQRTQAVLDIARTEHRMFLVVPITGFVTLLIAAGLGVAITRSITEPLGRLMEGFKALARGDFQHQVCVIGEGELAHLGRVFNETTGKLRDLHETLRNREEVLRQSEYRLRTTIDTSPVMAWVAGADGDLQIHNQGWLAYTGLPQEQLLGHGWRAAVHPDDLPGLDDHWRAALASAEPAEHEARLRRFDGEYRWFLFRGTPFRDNRGNVLKWYGINADIHDRKLAELENTRLYADLSESEYRLRTTLDAIPVMAWVAGPDGELEFHNQRWLAYTGVTEEQPLGQGWRAFVHPDDLPGLVNRVGCHTWPPGSPENTKHGFDASMENIAGFYFVGARSATSWEICSSGMERTRIFTIADSPKIACGEARLIWRKLKGSVIREVGLGMFLANGFSGRPKRFAFLGSTQLPQRQPWKYSCSGYIRTIVPSSRTLKGNSPRGMLRNTTTASYFQTIP